MAFGSVRGVLVPSNENTEYFKIGQMARNEDTTETAHVCTAAQYREAVNNPDLGMGFPIKDVRFLGGSTERSRQLN